MERRITLPASREEVWHALTQPAPLSDWFGADVVELDVRPGGRLVVRDEDRTIRRALIETVDPPSALIFRWLPIEQDADGAAHPAPATTVEIHLIESQEGTELTVFESPRTLTRL